MNRFGSTLAEVERFASAFSVEALSTVLPPGMIQEALEECGAASRRRRSLPAELVVWLTVMAGVWRGRGLRNVLAGMGRGLCRGLGWMGGSPPTSAAITRARRRLGEGPLRSLFDRVTRRWMAESLSRWRDMALLAIDGTTLRMPDSRANRAAFGAHRTYGRPTAYPLTRVVVVMCALTHVVLRAAIGTSRTSERALFPDLLDGLPARSLFLLDRGFFGLGMLWDVGRAQHHVVVRLRQRTRLWRRRRMGPGDYLAEVRPSAKSRRRHPQLPERWTLRVVTYRIPGFRPVRLLTTLIDPVAYPAAEIAARYRDRWEVELGFDEIKTHLLGEHVPLRSKSPELVRQEIHATLLAYDALRILMVQAASARHADPRRLSFSDGLDRLRQVAVTMAAVPALALPWIFDAFLEDLGTCTLPPRRPRRYPRTVKTLPCYYPIRRRHRAA